MPQLVKGGKNVFGWSKVSESGEITIPPDAYDEYRYSNEKYVYLLSGSRKSGGFGLITLNLLRASLFSDVLADHPELLNPQSIIGESIKYRSRIFSIAPIDLMKITVPIDILELYGIKKGSMLLAVRGSFVALGFIVKGPIIEEALKHPELKIYD
jgi:hypothetical protein